MSIKRKVLVVDKGLQLRFAKFVMMGAFAASVITGLSTFYTVYTMLGERLAQVYPQGRLDEIFRSVQLAFVLNLVLVIPVIFYLSLKFSHRIAGPLPKIYAALKNIGEGNFNVRLVLRKGDELQDLADAINSMAKNLKENSEKK